MDNGLAMSLIPGGSGEVLQLHSGPRPAIAEAGLFVFE
jgi:hypothetical protein